MITNGGFGPSDLPKADVHSPHRTSGNVQGDKTTNPRLVGLVLYSWMEGKCSLTQSSNPCNVVHSI